MRRGRIPPPGELGALVLLFDLPGTAHRLAGFMSPVPVFGFPRFTGGKLVKGVGNLLLGPGEVGGCFRSSLAQRGNTCGQAGEVTFRRSRMRFAPLLRPGDACPLPGGVHVCPAQCVFGAAYGVLAGFQCGLGPANGLLHPLAHGRSPGPENLGVLP